MAYGEDLAEIHDAHFGFLARAAATTLLESLRRRKLLSGRVLDLGCGSGILSEALTAAGYQTYGIDASRAMLRRARLRVPRATFRRGTLRSAKWPQAVAAAAVGECFNYRFDGSVSEAVLSRMFRRVRRSLPRGGLFLLDLAAPGRGGATGTVTRHWEGCDWALLMTAEEDAKRGRLVRRITTFRKIGARYRRATETHRLELVSPERATRLLESAGFRVRRLRRYAEVRLPPGLFGYLCTAR